MSHVRHVEKCPHCGRSLTGDELYCHFCEKDLSQLRKKHEKSSENHSSGGHH